MDKKIAMFPLKKETNKKEKPIKRTFIEINCNENCRRPEFFKMGKERTNGERMAECEECELWFHQECEKIPDKIFKDDSLKYFCSKCQTAKRRLSKK